MNNILSKVLFFVCLVLTVSCGIYQTPGFNPIIIVTCIFIGLVISLVFCFIKPDEKSINFFKIRPSHFFIVAYCIVFFQKPIDFLLGYNLDYIQIGSAMDMTTCVRLSLVGLCSFVLGYFTKIRKTIRNSDNIINYVSSPRIFIAISFLLLIMVILFVPNEILMGGYGQSMIEKASLYNYLTAWINLFIIAYFVQFSINRRFDKTLVGSSIKKYFLSIDKGEIVVIIIYLLIILNTGDRGPLIFTFTTILFSYLIVARRNLKIKYMAPLFIIGVLFISFLGDTKQYRSNNSIIERIERTIAGSDKEKKKSFLESTEELSGSYNCLAYSVANVPSKDDYNYGKLQLSYLFAAIPFSSVFVEPLLNLPQKSSSIISHYIQGDWVLYGNGSSCIADLYLDGGIVGIIIGMFLFGVILHYFEIILFDDKHFSLFLFCFALYYIGYMFYIPRSMILGPFKYALWLYIIFLLRAKNARSIR